MRRAGSLFSGVGLLDLGFCRGWGAEPVFFAEADDWCRAVLAWHHPGVPMLRDAASVCSELGPVDGLVGGFPCQPVSQAGRGMAQEDDRWLWPLFADAIRVLEPAVVFIENVEGLLGRGLGLVLGGLADLGYDAEWDLVPALAIGAPHLRYRVFIVARKNGGVRGTFAGATARDSLAQLPPWPDESPFLPRLVRKVPQRRQRLQALGNGVVPQVAEWVASRVDVEEPPMLGHPFAWRQEGAWTTGQVSLLDAGEHDETWPRAGTVVDGRAYELDPVFPRVRRREDLWLTPTSAPWSHGGCGGELQAQVALWPTPAANEAEWSVEALEACVDKDGGPAKAHERIYHPETGQIVQNTLANYVKGAEAGLWPTPLGNPANRTSRKALTAKQWSRPGLEQVAEIEEGILPREYEHEDEMRGASRGRLDRAREVWPTPTAGDAKASGSRNLEGSDAHAGVSLTDAVRFGDSKTPRRVYPTPAAADATGGRRAGSDVRERGTRDSGAKAQRTLAEAAEDADRLWPTPTARDHKGADLASREGGPGLPQAVAAAGRVWPTPQARDFHGPQGNSYDGSADDLPGAVSRADGGGYDLAEKVWPTPKASPSGPDYARAERDESGGDDLATAAARENRREPGGGLNPAWVEWLMGALPGWTDLPEERRPERKRKEKTE